MIAVVKKEDGLVTKVITSATTNSVPAKVYSNIPFKLMAQYGTDNSGSAGILAGDRYPLSAEALLGEETGFALDAGRNADRYLDFHVAAEKLGDINDFVLGARKRFNRGNVSANVYLGDLKGFSAEAEIAILNRKNYNLQGVIGGHSLKINNRKGNGVDLGARANWNITKRLGLGAEAMYTSDNEVMKEGFRVVGGINYSFGAGRFSDINAVMRIPHISLNSVNLENKVEDTGSSGTTAPATPAPNSGITVTQTTTGSPTTTTTISGSTTTTTIPVTTTTTIPPAGPSLPPINPGNGEPIGN